MVIETKSEINSKTTIRLLYILTNSDYIIYIHYIPDLNYSIVELSKLNADGPHCTSMWSFLCTLLYCCPILFLYIFFIMHPSHIIVKASPNESLNLFEVR